MMRLRVKLLMVFVASTILFVLAFPPNALAPHLHKLGQLGHLERLVRLLNQKTFDLGRLNSVTSTAPPQRRVSPLSSAPAHGNGHAQNKTLDEQYTNLTTKLDDNPKQSVDNNNNNNTLKNILANEQIELAKDTMRLQHELEEAATPAGFVDVPRKNENTKKTPKLKTKKKKKVESKVVDMLLNNTAKYSPKALHERAKLFNPNSAVGRFVSEQQRRVAHIRRACVTERRRKQPSVMIAGIEDVAVAIQAYNNFIYDRVNRLTFCPVYKAASTSWSTTLLQLRGLWRPGKGRHKGLQALLRQVFPRLSSIAGSTMIASTTKFMVVRHPFERLVSCYRDKYEDARKSYYYKMYGEKMVRMFRPRPRGFTPEEALLMLHRVRKQVERGVGRRLRGNFYAQPIGPTFYEFVSYVTSTPHDDEHWRPYYVHCASCYVDYDVILRFENMFEEGGTFIEYLNRSALVQLRWENPSKVGASTSDVACSYFNQLTMKLVAELLKKYATDFLLYEYSVDEYIKCAKDYTKGVTLHVEASDVQHKLKKLAEPFR